MSAELQVEAVPLTGWRRIARDTENLGVTLALLAMMLLPVLQIVMRKAGWAGISGSTAIVQQFTLIVGMFGGAVAARDGRLLAAEIVRSSGVPEFDRGVLAGIRAGAPYTPLPPDIKGDSASFDLPLVSVTR